MTKLERNFSRESESANLHRPERGRPDRVGGDRPLLGAKRLFVSKAAVSFGPSKAEMGRMAAASLRAFSHRRHVSITPRHQGHDCRPCEVFQGGRNVFRVVPLDHFD